MSRFGLILLFTSACGPAVAPPSGEGASGAATSSTSGDEVDTTGLPSGTSTGLPSGSSTSTSAPPEDVPTCSFLCDADVGSTSECSVWDQDCPPGERCAYHFSEDGQIDFDMHHCVPIAADAGEPGEPCSVGGETLSDTCGLGGLCWYVDPETNTGTCVSLCTGTPDAPECADPDATCSIPGSGVFAFCSIVCDPSSPAPCPGATTVCYPDDPWSPFTCHPRPSSGSAGPFANCEATSDCESGTVCMEWERVGICDVDATACCATLCDLTSPTCPAGTTCVPYYEPGQAFPGSKDLGFCGQP